MKAASSATTTGKVLLADIGGTNARFALLADGTVGAIAHMAVSDYGSFREALGAYLGGLPEAGTIRAAILAASGVGPERPLRSHQQFLGDRCRRVARCLRIFHRASDQ